MRTANNNSNFTVEALVAKYRNFVEDHASYDIIGADADFIGSMEYGLDGWPDLSAIDKVKNGISIFIFPEGTRNTTDAPILDFHKGSFKIAQKSGCPIVPVVINHSRDIFENHMPFIKATHVTIEYCPPVYISELDKEDQRNIDTYVKDIIEKTYIKNEK